MKILVTGVAGFIGMHTAIRLLKSGTEVVGIDNLNTYYEPKLKDYRLEQLKKYDNFKFIKLDICNREGISKLFKEEKFSRVIHLAAQAGVRFSIEKPFEYTDSNITGFLTILEGCRHNEVEHLVYASSSSVYGMNEKVPFSEEDFVDSPVSLYAATKKANELMAHSYSKLYKINTTGLRFFTVYGPAGRPDMAPWLFTDAVLSGRQINVFNNGNMERDFTYIDDIVDGVVAINNELKTFDADVPARVFNIGNSDTVRLEYFIDCIEKATGKKANKNYMPMQKGDVEKTFADVTKLTSVTGLKPQTKIEDGIKNFVEWFKEYYEIH